MLGAICNFHAELPPSKLDLDDVSKLVLITKECYYGWLVGGSVHISGLSASGRNKIWACRH